MSVTDTFATTASTLQEWSLSALKSGDEAIVEAVKSVTSALEPVSRQVASTPFAEYLPKPTALVGQWFSFIESVIAEQKRFGLDLVASLPGASSAAGTPSVASQKSRTTQAG